ncbi:phage holin family protein [Helicobacter sp. 11S02596-1]|uniref:phage holin family protein n=1 Tax=Helicobacter sp. 11S02596-1 TaxID=1476194 RepID=UPI000BA5399E|nr:phage holin family protein [Helicobacter sp. 11S02596-1]PAF41125.1 hypothetical protein BJI48_09025 [Helicobacter sp. 11S02596-1]
MDFFETLKFYGWILIIGLIVGFLFVLRSIEEKPIETIWQGVRFVIYGVGSSMFITWLGFELFLYLGLPTSLAAALGGGFGFIGANTIAGLIIRVFKAKTGLSDDKEEKI